MSAERACGTIVEKRIVVAVALGVLVALGSAHAQKIENGGPQKVQNAIGKGAEVDAQDKSGQTALMREASNSPNTEAITALLKMPARMLRSVMHWAGLR